MGCALRQQDVRFEAISHWRLLGLPDTNPDVKRLFRRLKGFRRIFSRFEKREKPNPTYIDVANQATQWLARHTGGITQSSIVEALANIPTTAHVLGGAVIGADASSGVVDRQLRIFDYQNMLVCDGSAMPANPGVNPALSITALAEYAMSHVPDAGRELIAEGAA